MWLLSLVACLRYAVRSAPTQGKDSLSVLIFVGRPLIGANNTDLSKFWEPLCRTMGQGTDGPERQSLSDRRTETTGSWLD